MIDLGQSPEFVEYNPESNGLHAYFHFNRSLTDKENSALIRFYEDQNKFIEIISGRQLLRLPCSIDYAVHGEFAPQEENYVKQYPIKDCLLKIVNSRKTINADTNKLLKKAVSMFAEETPKLFCLRKKRGTFSICGENISMGSGVEKYSYGRGTRYVNQTALAMYCAGKGMTFDQYYDAAVELNKFNSRDMAKWSIYTRERKLRSYFNWALEHATIRKSSFQTKSNGNALIDENGDEWIVSSRPNEFQLALKQFPSTVRNDLKSYLSYVYRLHPETFRAPYGGKIQKDLIETSVLFLEFLRAKKEYDESREKKYVQFSSELSPLLKGTPFPKELFYAFAQAIDSKRSMNRAVHLLRKSGVLKIAKSASGMTHSWIGRIRFCFHYLVDLGPVYHKISEEQSHIDWILDEYQKDQEFQNIGNNLLQTLINNNFYYDENLTKKYADLEHKIGILKWGLYVKNIRTYFGRRAYLNKNPGFYRVLSKRYLEQDTHRNRFTESSKPMYLEKYKDKGYLMDRYLPPEPEPPRFNSYIVRLSEGCRGGVKPKWSKSGEPIWVVHHKRGFSSRQFY